MTDISVIKMIISVAVWRIYPSWVNDKLRAWEGLGHSGMFWARLSRDDFRSQLEIISFLSRVMSVSKSFFLFPALLKDLAPNVQAPGLLVSMMFCGSFWKLRSFTGHFLRTLTTTISISWKFPFFFPKQSRFYLPDSYGDPKSEQSTLVMVRRKLEWKLDFRALARSSAEGPSIVVAIGTSRVRWSMVQKRKKNTRKSACDCAKAQPFIIYKPASFEEPVSETRRRYRFALRCFRGRRCTAAGRSACSAGTAKKSSHPWHFRRWSLRHNELECTNLVHWTEALHRFSSRDAIIVVGSVLEKHFGSDFTPDQEKEITFKRWPPGYQSWKLGLALNGLIILLW